LIPDFITPSTRIRGCVCAPLSPPITGLLPPTDVFECRGARMLNAEPWRKRLVRVIEEGRKAARALDLYLTGHSDLPAHDA